MTDDIHDNVFDDAINLAIETIKTRRQYYNHMLQGYIGKHWTGPYSNICTTRYSLLIDECDAIAIELALLLRRKDKDES